MGSTLSALTALNTRDITRNGKFYVNKRTGRKVAYRYTQKERKSKKHRPRNRGQAKQLKQKQTTQNKKSRNKTTSEKGPGVVSHIRSMFKSRGSGRGGGAKGGPQPASTRPNPFHGNRQGNPLSGFGQKNFAAPRVKTRRNNQLGTETVYDD